MGYHLGAWQNSVVTLFAQLTFFSQGITVCGVGVGLISGAEIKVTEY